MKKIGLTGNMGTGKSTVAWMFQELFVDVVDADEIAHEVIMPHTPAWQALFERYGKKILQADGIIDRHELATIIFNDDHERKFVESVIHPHVKHEVEQRTAILRKAGKPFCIIEAPLLFEAHWDKEMDLIVVVTCDEETEIKRCEEKFGFSREEILQRLGAQWPLAKKVDKADVIIDNAGSLEETRVQVERLCRQWEKGDFSKR